MQAARKRNAVRGFRKDFTRWARDFKEGDGIEIEIDVQDAEGAKHTKTVVFEVCKLKKLRGELHLKLKE